MPFNLRELVRQFPENGLKLLLETPLNVRDLLAVIGTRFLPLIDFAEMEAMPTTFVARDYRHVEADLVLRTPLRRKGAARWHQLLLYVLLEHQSQPDRLMPLRLLDYVVQAYKWQVREAEREHGSADEVVLQPVLPVVFYTGRRRWPSPGTLAELVELAALLDEQIPLLKPLFLNLRQTPPEHLTSVGGFFGWVLRLVQQRQAPESEFRETLHEAVAQLEHMPKGERLRWLQFLSYIHALVYHDRDPEEHPRLHQLIEQSVETDEHRREVTGMRRSMADLLKEEGALENSRKILLHLLRTKYRKVPPEIAARVETTTDVDRLEEWLTRVVTARSLAGVGIEPEE